VDVEAEICRADARELHTPRGVVEALPQRRVARAVHLDARHDDERTLEFTNEEISACFVSIPGARATFGAAPPAS
jgi:hypothetical protein